MEPLNVQLSGFKDIDAAAMSDVNKLLSTYAHKISEVAEQPEMLKLKLERVHKRPKSEIYQVHGMLLDKGKKYNAVALHRNLLTAVDTVLERLDRDLRDIHSRVKR